MKRLISLFLSIVMVLSSIIGVDLSALAVDNPDDNNFDIQGYFDDYQNKADDFNYLQYVSRHYTSDKVKNTIEFRINQETNCYNLVDYLKNNLWFKGNYAIWEAANFATNPSEIVGRQLNKETYYETIILRILNSSVTSDNAIDWLNQGAIKNSVKISKHITQASENSYYSYLANMHMPISDFTSEEYDKTIEFSKNYINSQGYKIFGKDVSFLSDVLSMSKDIEEYSEKLASYCQLIELGDAIADFLEEVKINSDDKNLINAINEVIPIIKDSYSDMLKTAAKEGLYCIGSFALKKIVGDTWKKCLINLLNNGYLFDGTAIVGSVFLAIGITKTFTNIVFNVDAKLDKYELMKALCSFEQSMETAIHKKINSFENTEEYANVLLEGVSIVYQTYIIDTEIYSEMTRICQNDWIGNLSKDEYEKIMEICNYNKELYQNEYDSLKVVSGICGDALGWVITYDNELLIYGIGEMYDFEKEKAPWYDYKNRFNNLYISKLTTVLGGYAFYNCDNIINDLYLDHNITIHWNCFDNIPSNITLISKEDLTFFGCQKINYMIICNGNMNISVLADDDFLINNIVKVAGNLICTFKHIYRDNTVTSKTVKLVVNSKLLISGSCTLNTDNCRQIIASLVYGDILINLGGEVIIDKNLTMNGYPSSEDNWHTKNFMRMYVKGNLIVKKNVNTYSYSKFYIDDDNAKVIVKNDFYNTGDIYAMRGEIFIYGIPNGLCYCHNGNANWYLYGSKIKLSTLYISGGELGNGSVTLCGDVEQTVSEINVHNLYITNNAGVNFTATVKVSGLFNHNGNPFILYNNGEGSSFFDYDGDGYNDNVDPYPLVKQIDEHKWEFTKTVAPTCNTQGYDLYTCSVCNGTEKRNTVNATGHNYKEKSNTATCTNAGVKTTVCSKCGDTKTSDVSALGHSYNKVYTAPICTKDGGYTNTCTHCGDVTYNIYSASGHDYGDCMGEDYIKEIYDTNSHFIENVPSTANYYGKTFYTTSAFGRSITQKMKVSYPLQIRLDKDNLDIIENYKFYVSRSGLSLGSSIKLNSIFAYNQNSGRNPQESAIPYTDKNGNLVNMKYVDYKENNEWINGEYIINNNQIIDINGNMISSNYSETRAHIVYLKDDALKNGIMNNDGTVNINSLDCEISFSSGVEGIYTTIYNASIGNYVSALGYDDNVKTKSGVYDVSLCFYGSGAYTIGNILLKIYDDSLITKTPATVSTDEKVTYTCIDCGETHTDTCELNIADFKIKTVSLSLESSITMNFKVLKSAVSDFENPYVVFNCEGDELTVTDYTEQGDYYVFSYHGISPQLMNDNVKTVLHATHNGIDYTSPEKIMSVRTYAYTMLERYNSDDYAELRTLLVDLLNYGAASQKYIGYQTDNLVNADLTDEQKAWGTSTAPTFENIRNYDYKTIANPTSKWVGSGLVLNNSVMVRAKFSADNIENKTVKITCGKGEFTYAKDDFIQDKDGNYYVYCNEIFANEMSEEILLTVYDNGVQCSNTMRFSIESYAKLVHDNHNGTVLDELTTAMMRYGNSAKAYGA